MRKNIKSFNKFMNEDFVTSRVPKAEIQDDPISGPGYVGRGKYMTEPQDEMEEEEGGYSKYTDTGWDGDQKMQDLLEILNLPATSKFPIEIDGTKIDYYSETGNFHIEEEGLEFETAQEVKDFLDEKEDPIGQGYRSPRKPMAQMDMEDRPMRRDMAQMDMEDRPMRRTMAQDMRSYGNRR